MRALVLAVFDLTRQLRQRDDRDVQLFGDGLQTLGDFRDFLHPVLFRRTAKQLQIVDDQHIQPMRALQPPCPCRNLGNRQGGRVVDVKRAAFQRLCGFDKAAKLRFGHVAPTDLFGRHFGGFRQDPRGKLFGRHLKAEEPDHPAFDRPLAAIRQTSDPAGLGDVEGDIGGQRGLAHRRPPGQNQKV